MLVTTSICELSNQMTKRFGRVISAAQLWFNCVTSVYKILCLCVSLCNDNNLSCSLIGRCVRALVKCGADLERECSQGRTPLYLACEQGHVESVKVLLDAGADCSHVTTVSFQMRTGTSVAQMSITFCVPEHVRKHCPSFHLHGYLNSWAWVFHCLCVAQNVITAPILETLNYALDVFSVCSNLLGWKKPKISWEILKVYIKMFCKFPPKELFLYLFTS